MTRREQKLFAVIAIVFAGLLLHSWFNRGPKYRTKPAQYWANALIRGGEHDYLLAALALHEIGPDDAVPVLVKALRSSGSPVYLEIWRRLPINLQIRLPNGFAELNNRYRAAAVLGEFGPPAKAAVPDLIASLASSNIALKCSSATALAEMGPEARVAIPPLEAMATSKYQFISNTAVNALRKIRSTTTNQPTSVRLGAEK